MIWTDISQKKRHTKPGVVARIYNPSPLGGLGGQIAEVRSSRPAWTTWQDSISTKNKNEWGVVVWLWSQPLWRLRQKDYLSPGGQGCGELWFYHCTPTWATWQTLSQKKKMSIERMNDEWVSQKIVLSSLRLIINLFLFDVYYIFYV